MKKIFSFTAVLAIFFLAACNQKQNVVADATSTEGINSIDVEKLIEPIDLQMDISNLSVSDLHILRHAFAARKGYPFEDAYLRSIYRTTTWYDSLVWNFDGTTDNFMDVEENDSDTWRQCYYKRIKEGVLQNSDEELAFIKRVKEREDELLQQNFSAPEGYRVVMRNMLNARQMLDIDTALADCIARNGFAIVQSQHQQLFHVYEQNDYRQFPSFVTTDLFLQLYHLYFDAMLREVEESQLTTLAFNLIRDMRININYDWCSEPDNAYGKFAHHDAQYLSIAERLLTGKNLANVNTNEAIVDEEIAKVMASENDFSQFIGDFKEVMFPYSLYRPRGHYTRNDTLKHYFRAMMWLQNVPFGLDSEEQTAQALILANELNRNEYIRANYERLNNILTFLMGPSDDLSLLQVAEVLKAQPLSIKQLIATPGEVEKIRIKLNSLAEKQTRIRPKFQRTSRNKICFMPQRYQPDAEVMQEMVDYDNIPTKRAVPQGLDIMASLGVKAAEQILLKEKQEWEGLQPTLKRMKLRMDSTDWQETITKQWLQALKEVNQTPDNAPYFMDTPEWQRKSLNASLASWAELKHDAILYAKQPCGAECGGGCDVPDPVLKGYVEPNIGFWQRAVDLVTATEKLLEKYDLQTERTMTINERLGDMAYFLLTASNKELKGELLSDEEYDQIQHVGATCEYISLELLREGEHYLQEWSDVQGPERNIAIIADVYTANADNNPKKSVLYAGVGQADEIYVMVEIHGYLYLTRGAVFSYRELTRPLNEQRMTDEEWQQRLEKDARQGVPEWMQPIIVPLHQQPTDNEEVFYSSGC